MDRNGGVSGPLVVASVAVGFLTLWMLALLISFVQPAERGPAVVAFWLLVWVLGTYLVARGAYASGRDVQRRVELRRERLRPAREKKWMESNPGHSKPEHDWEWVQAAVTVRCRECGCWGGRPVPKYLESEANKSDRPGEVGGA